jgi:hypothetical protein
MSIAQPAFDFDSGTEIERLKGQVPWQAPDSSYLGIHPRAEPDYNGHSHFDVYGFSGFFLWSACTPDGRHRGYRHGPYETAQQAYLRGERGEE